MAKNKVYKDENTAARDRRIEAYEGLPPKTRVLVDQKAKSAGFDSFLGMVQFFWQEKVYPFFEKAYYGPQEGFLKLLDRLKHLFKKRHGQPEVVSALDAVGPDASEEERGMAAMQAVVADIETLLAGSKLEGPAVEKVLDMCFQQNSSDREIEVEQRR